MPCMSRKTMLLFAAMLCFVCQQLPAQTSLGSITITGSEQSSGSTWDTGTVTATINGVSVSIAYGHFSTPSSIASALGVLISQNCNMPVYAIAVGATINFYQKGSNTISSESITSVSNDSSLFSSGSFSTNGGSTSSAPQITGLSLSNGPPSMGFVIQGSGFGATQAGVTVGGMTATVVSWTSTSITVQVPAGAVPGNVVVTVNGIPSNGWPFTVDPPFVCN